MIQRQSLLTFILLTVFTCGIYSIIWIYSMTTELNRLAEEAGAPPEMMVNPTTEILLCIFTCGIYSYIWIYKHGNKMKMIGNEKDIPINEEGSAYILFILLGAVTCGIFTFYAYHLFIKNFNMLADDYNATTQYGQY